MGIGESKPTSSIEYRLSSYQPLASMKSQIFGDGTLLQSNSKEKMFKFSVILDNNDTRRLNEMACIWKSLEHHNLVNLLNYRIESESAICSSVNYFCFYVEFSKWTLEKEIKRRSFSNQFFQPEEIKDILISTLSALQLLEYNQINIFEISTTSIFVMENSNYKLAHNFISYTQIRKQRCYNPPYSMICLIKNKLAINSQQQKENLWYKICTFQLGMILLEAASLQEHYDCFEKNKIKTEELKFRIEGLQSCYDEIKAIIKQMLRLDEEIHEVPLPSILMGQFTQKHFGQDNLAESIIKLSSHFPPSPQGEKQPFVTQTDDDQFMIQENTRLSDKENPGSKQKSTSLYQVNQNIDIIPTVHQQNIQRDSLIFKNFNKENLTEKTASPRKPQNRYEQIRSSLIDLNKKERAQTEYFQGSKLRQSVNYVSQIDSCKSPILQLSSLRKNNLQSQGSIKMRKSQENYDGKLVNNKKNGFGTVYKQNSKPLYSGNWQDDCYHGDGVLYNESPKSSNKWIYKDLSDQSWLKYTGQFQMGKRVGVGQIQYINGEKFVGNFVNDKATGTGQFYQVNGVCLKGIWQENKFQQKY